MLSFHNQVGAIKSRGYTVQSYQELKKRAQERGRILRLLILPYARQWAYVTVLYPTHSTTGQQQKQKMQISLCQGGRAVSVVVHLTVMWRSLGWQHDAPRVEGGSV